MNSKDPPISSSFSSFGPSSDSSEFGSTSYINYPPTFERENSEPKFNSIFTPNQDHPALSGYTGHSTPYTGHSSPYTSSSNYLDDNFKSHKDSYQGKPESSDFFKGYSSPSSGNNYQDDYYKSTKDSYQNSFSSQTHSEEVPISQHVEITRPVVVPVYKKFPYPVSKRFPVAIPHPVLGKLAKLESFELESSRKLFPVPYPAPYPVNVDVSQPVAVPVIRTIRIPIEREVMYPVERYVPVTIEKPVQYQVEKHYPVYVPKPYPVKVSSTSKSLESSH